MPLLPWSLVIVVVVVVTFFFFGGGADDVNGITSQGAAELSP